MGRDFHGGSVSPISAGLRARCPRCGEGKLFKRFIEPADKCAVCDLDYGFADSGDGPAVFIILILGCVIVGAALLVELNFSPPLWVHAVLWLPVTLGLALALMRPFKATLIALQYSNAAREGRLED